MTTKTTEYKIKGGARLIFSQWFLSATEAYWSYELMAGNGEVVLDSADDEYATLSNAKRGFRAAQKLIAKFEV